jgi:glycine/D-amino acid oxidase-like deaminating enzyme
MRNGRRTREASSEPSPRSRWEARGVAGRWCRVHPGRARASAEGVAAPAGVVHNGRVAMPGSSFRSNVANVLVIGTGAAGLRAAIAAHQAGSEVVVIGKRRRDDAHTVLAAGGINAALGTVDPQDSWQQHFADTLREGYFLADPRVVELMATEAPAAVQELADWGAPFARLPDGRLDQRFFGAHRWRRTCYAGDWTGRAVLRTLAAKVAELGLAVVDDQYVSEPGDGGTRVPLTGSGARRSERLG